MAQPPAEISLSDADIARLVSAQHPRLSARVRRVAHGWDNDLFRLGDDLAVRVPRRAAAVPLVAREQRWLGVLSPLVPVPIPVPVALGAPDEDFPWPWSVVPWFGGERALDRSLARRDAFAAQLGGILRALHVPAPPDAPVNPVRAVPLAARNAAVRARLVGAPALARIWGDALVAPMHSGPRVWVHGDPHPGNVLVDDDGDRIVALLDFGDLSAGDPACDLAVAWLAFTPRGRGAFRAATGADEATWRRARGWAAAIAALLRDADDPALRDMSAHAVAELTG